MKKIIFVIVALCCFVALFSGCEQQPQPVAVSAVYLNTSSYDMTEGETVTLEATVSPDNADNKKIIWSSSNASVTSVSNGVVTAIKEGEATISATSDDGGKKAECRIKVHAKTVNVSSISLSAETLTLEEGASETLVATIEPENASNKNVSWSSSNESVATVDENGKVTGIEAGTATIIVTTEDGGKIATCEVTVIARVSGISLDKTSLTLEEGARETLTATITPSNASNQYLTWESSDTYVATVDAFGQVTAIEAGTATITVTTKDGGISATCEVTVIARIEGVSLNKTSLTLSEGESETLTATIKPDNASNKKVTWKSSDTSVATVDENGKVTAVKTGIATIIVTTEEGSKTATCTVTVSSTSSGSAEYVDFGLSVKWATCNLGASMPEEYGLYYQWGDTQGYGSDTNDGKYFDWEDKNGNIAYKWHNGSQPTLTKYNTHSSYGPTVDNKTVLDPSDDAAYVALGGKWRMPTDAEWTELRNNCTWTWTTVNGRRGYKVTSKMPGYTDKSIFLPAAGWRFRDLLDDDGHIGSYWSSSLYSYTPSYAYEVDFGSGAVNRSSDYRCYGLSIRPVYGDGDHVSSVTLSKASLSLKVGDSETLTATVNPSTASNKFVTWKSSKTGVATVDANGKVTAIEAGTSTITVTTVDGSKTATCTVTVSSPSTGSAQYVDLGLSVKWATCNLGASKPEELGLYYQWGDIRGYDTDTSDGKYFSWNDKNGDITYIWCKGSFNTLTKYNTHSSYGPTVDNKTVLDPSDDAAYVALGGKWRMPTDAEWTELRENCTWTWTTVNGRRGYKVTSRKSGYTDKSIFLPAAGNRSEDLLGRVGSSGDYWSSSLNKVYPDHACGVGFSSGYVTWSGLSRYYGQSVRPVSE